MKYRLTEVQKQELTTINSNGNGIISINADRDGFFIEDDFVALGSDFDEHITWFNNIKSSLVTMRSAVKSIYLRLSLENSNLLAGIEIMLDLPENREDKIKFEYFAEFLIDSPVIVSISQKMNMDQATLDSVFEYANTLQDLG